MSINEDLKFGIKESNDDNITTINKWISESESWHDVMLRRQNKSVRYYLGNQTDLYDIPAYNSNSVYNRIFEATETVVPVVTGAAHEFIAVPGDDKEDSVDRAGAVQSVLSELYRILNIKNKNKIVVRDIILKRFGVMKWFWNSEIDDVDVKVIDPRFMFIPKVRMDANDPALPYILELQEYDEDDIKEFFPDVDIEDLKKGKDIDINSNTGSEEREDRFYVGESAGDIINDRLYQVIEVTTNEAKMWKQGNIILKSIENQYFDFDNSEEETEETPEGKEEVTLYDKSLNHFASPRKNYVFFNPFVTGASPVADTSLCEIAIPIQNDINTQKRQIINNLIKMGNGQVYLDSDALPKELEDAITSEPGLVLVGKNLASENKIKRVPGVPLPNAHFANLNESITAFDNVFGVHGALRGSSGSKTLGGQVLDRQQDVSRIDSLVSALNEGMSLLADGLVQMMKMYYDEEHTFRILGRDGTTQFLKFSNEQIDDGIVIHVKSGIPQLVDPITKANQAIQLWQLNAISPETLYERLGFSDPQSEVLKLQAWNQGQALFDSQLKREEAVEGVESKASIEAANEERNVETPANVIDRATKSANEGGGKAPVKNRSNSEKT